MIQKMGLSVKLDDNNKPIAVLYRTLEGNWTWHKISEMAEDEQCELMENNETKNTIN